MTIHEQDRERVAAGAALLDLNEPGWRDRIDLSSLDLASGCLCILGQVFAHLAKDTLFIDGYTIGFRRFGFETRQDAIDYGFDIPRRLWDDDAEPSRSGAEQWQDLQEAWVENIEQARGVTEHTHHYVPRRAGRNGQGEPVQQLACECGQVPA